MSSKVEINAESSQISREAVEWLLRRILQIPKSWLIISSIFILFVSVLTKYNVSAYKRHCIYDIAI